MFPGLAHDGVYRDKIPGGMPKDSAQGARLGRERSHMAVDGSECRTGNGADLKGEGNQEAPANPSSRAIQG